MTKMYKILMLMSMVSGTMITISSYSWLGMWMGMEINLLCIIPLMCNNKNVYSSESAIKYFITQAMASTLFLISILLMSKEQFMTNPYNKSLILMNISMFTKMGAAPFHFWLPEIIEGLNWMNCLLMLTWQKLAPLMVLLMSMKNKQIIYSVIITSMIIGGVMGLNQSSLRKILTFSSINHMGWMISAMMEKETIMLIYFTMYFIISFNTMMMFNTMNVFFTSQLFNKMKNNPINKIAVSMNFMSLGGLPPMLGFYPKWITINSLIQVNQLLLVVIMVITTLITLYFYMQIIISTVLINPSELNIPSSEKNKFLINLINSINLLSLPICTISFNFL